MGQKSVLESVKEQYEALPYPARDPEDEKYRLIQGVGNNLVALNHHCFQGKMDFRSDFRCLVAGGGTGDAVIYLAEQLRDFDAEIVYLDLSETSCNIAKERARIRNLNNIEWIIGSILDLPKMNLGEFDFINCSGVLHHLESTEAGLDALNLMLKDHGAIFAMLYGKYGRRAIYDMQELLRSYLPIDLRIQEKIQLTRSLLDVLPESNSFQKNRESWEEEISPRGNGDAGLYDLLLHSTDRCFDVPELYQLADSAGLYLQCFAVNQEHYNPMNLISDNTVRSHLIDKSLQQKQAIAEMLRCDLKKHEFYLTRQRATAASLMNEDNAVLLFWSLFNKQQELADRIIPGRNLSISAGGYTISIHCTEILKTLITHLNGKKSIREIIKSVNETLPAAKPDEIRRELFNIFSLLQPKNFVYLMEEGSYGTRLPDYSRFT